jgi:hypothetical protein
VQRRIEKINEEIYWIGQTTGILNKTDERTEKKIKKFAYTCISNLILGRKKNQTQSLFLYITESIMKSHFILENKVYNYKIGQLKYAFGQLTLGGNLSDGQVGI